VADAPAAALAVEEEGWGARVLVFLGCYELLLGYRSFDFYLREEKVYSITLIYRCCLGFNPQQQNLVLDTHQL
jgi:hypothetical protein